MGRRSAGQFAPARARPFEPAKARPVDLPVGALFRLDKVDKHRSVISLLMIIIVKPNVPGFSRIGF